MVKKYSKALENWEINAMTDKVWIISDVPDVWKSRVKMQVEKDGYTWDDKGRAIPTTDTPS